MSCMRFFSKAIFLKSPFPVLNGHVKPSHSLLLVTIDVLGEGMPGLLASLQENLKKLTVLSQSESMPQFLHRLAYTVQWIIPVSPGHM